MHTVPQNYTVFCQHDDISATIYRGGMALIAFAGKSLKCKWHYRFQTEAQLATYANDWIERLKKEAAEKAAANARRKAPSPLLPDDIICSTWGVEQSNVDYYIVTERFGKYGVVLQQISAKKTEYSDGGWSGKCVPDPDLLIGKPFRKKSDGEGWVNLTSYSGAKPEPYTIVDGVRTYRQRYWSSYA